MHASRETLKALAAKLNTTYHFDEYDEYGYEQSVRVAVKGRSFIFKEKDGNNYIECAVRFEGQYLDYSNLGLEPSVAMISEGESFEKGLAFIELVNSMTDEELRETLENDEEDSFEFE